jgi:hypothetical protein
MQRNETKTIERNHEIMKFSDAYRGSFLKAADLGGKARRYTIATIGQEEVADAQKIVMRFREGDQALVLNKTNASVLQDAWGEEMDDWVGHAVILKPDKTDFQGKRVDCIRVSVPKPAPPVAQPEQGPDDIYV